MFQNRRVLAMAWFAVLAVASFGLGLSVFADDEGSHAGVRVAMEQRVTAAAAPGAQMLRLHTYLRSDENADAKPSSR